MGMVLNHHHHSPFGEIDGHLPPVPELTNGNRGMTRYPWRKKVAEYLESISKVLSPETTRQYRQHLDRAERVFAKAQGKNASPKRVTRDNVYSLLADIKHLTPTVQTHIIGHVRKFMIYCGNPIMEQVRAEGFFPRKYERRIYPLPMEDVQIILDSCDRLGGWQGKIVGFMCALIAASGARVGETRKALRRDLRLDDQEFDIRHPKGEGSWGQPRTTFVLSVWIPDIRRYIEERDELPGEHLVPKKALGYIEGYTDTGLRNIKQKVQKICPVQFNFRMLRATFAQYLKDNDVDIEIVSKLLGHDSIVTTMKYYAQMEGSIALRKMHSIDPRLKKKSELLARKKTGPEESVLIRPRQRDFLFNLFTTAIPAVVFLFFRTDEEGISIEL